MSEPDVPTTWVTPGTGPSPEGSAPAEDSPPPAPAQASDDRYQRLGLLGQGGMGEVYRVRDQVLGRVVAMKVLRTDLSDTQAFAARFAEEARVVAQLEHPGIPPVHDYGVRSDGRPWFTMMEIRGRNLREVLRLESAEAWSLRRLIDAFHTACGAVAYAHARGVLHRDLKPGNIMIGDFGEVMVVDWGLAKVLGQATAGGASDGASAGAADGAALSASKPGILSRSNDTSLHTRAGAVMGTPTYMSPEQRQGQSAAATPRSDVYGLGAILFRILTGKRPGDPALLRRVEAPEELKAVASRALAADPADRYPDAGALAEAIGAWLEGLRRRARAAAMVEDAATLAREPARLRERAAALKVEAKAMSAGLPVWATAEDKAPSWDLEDRAARLEASAREKLQERERLLHAALMEAPDLPEAHGALAELYREAHREAEHARDAVAQARAAGMMRAHLDALPAASTTRAAVETYLQGDGALTLVTDPPGAEVSVLRYVERGRRLVAELQQALGATPLTAAPLAMGSYLLELRAPGRPVTRYPVHIQRGQHWRGVPPDGDAPAPVPLSPALAKDEVYVPPGWYFSGTRSTNEGYPRRLLWCERFVMKRFPVTNREYLIFLDDLVAQGREAEALRWAPRELAGTLNEQGPMIYGRGDDGRFFLKPDIDGDLWQPDWPVGMVNWACAAAYARWYAARTGLPWRLPGFLEWEKAARGVDGRLFPWGDLDEGSWFNCNQSGPRPGPAPVDSFPVDTSPYGVRGLAGNVRDWTADGPVPNPRLDGPRVLPPTPFAPEAIDDASRFLGAGGGWPGAPFKAHCDRGVVDRAAYRHYGVGFRLLRPL